MLRTSAFAAGNDSHTVSSLAIVSTPMQYLNVVELTEKLRLPACHIFIVSRSYGEDDFQCLPRSSLICSTRFFPHVDQGSNLILPRIPFIARRGEKKRIKRHALSFLPKTVVNLVIGNSNEVYHQECVFGVGHCCLYLVDDGAAAVVGVSPELKKAGNNPVLFSAYGEKHPSYSFIKNDYSWLRSMVSRQFRRVDEVWFVGQYLVESGLITADQYFESVISALRCHRNKRLVYILHPREAMAQHHKRFQAAGLTVVRLDLSLELHIINTGAHPVRLVSFYSSVIQNSWAIFGESVPVDIVDIKSLFGARGRSRIELVYSHLKSSCTGPHRYIEI